MAVAGTSFGRPVRIQRAVGSTSAFDGEGSPHWAQGSPLPQTGSTLEAETFHFCELLTTRRPAQFPNPILAKRLLAPYPAMRGQ